MVLELFPNITTHRPDSVQVCLPHHSQYSAASPCFTLFALPIWRLAYEGNRQSWSGIVFWVKWCLSIKWSASFIKRITYSLVHLQEFLCGSSIRKVVNIPKPRHLIRYFIGGAVVTFPKNLREASGRCVIIDTEQNRREILSSWPIFCFQLCQLKALNHLTTCRRTSTRALQIEVTSAMCIIKYVYEYLQIAMKLQQHTSD